jgi:hypothetical protein
MSQVSMMLERTDRITHGASVSQLAMPAMDWMHDDDDILDEWLASVTVDEFERFLSGLAELP